MTAADAMSAARADRPAAPRSVLVGLIGSGIQASRTPAMHEREGAAQGVAYVYKIIDPDTLGLTPAGLPALLAGAPPRSRRRTASASPGSISPIRANRR